MNALLQLTGWKLQVAYINEKKKTVYCLLEWFQQKRSIKRVYNHKYKNKQNFKS